MTQVLTTTMAATLRASTEGLDIIDKARCKKGWIKTEQAWAELATTSRSTLRRFWAGTPVRTETFKEICSVAGVENWESIIDVKEEAVPIVYEASKRLSFAIAGSIEENDKRKLDAIVALLNKLGGDTSIGIVDIEEGSIKLILDGSPNALERIEALFSSGDLTEVLSISVHDVHFVSKEELIKLIQNNGGEALRLGGTDLSYANLRDANLSDASLFGANLSYANLRDANLIRSALISADLISADLINADLSYADLSYADLSYANLRDANLSYANLRDANLINADLGYAYLKGAYLRDANLSRADLRDADLRDANVIDTRFSTDTGFSEEAKQDLIQRGAIFEDALGDHVFRPAPSGGR